MDYFDHADPTHQKLLWQIGHGHGHGIDYGIPRDVCVHHFALVNRQSAVRSVAPCGGRVSDEVLPFRAMGLPPEP